MSVLLTFHSLFRWVVLVVLVGAIVVGFLQAARRAVWRPGSDRPFLVAAIVLDVQVVAGTLLYLLGQGWTRGFFIAAIHPVAMLTAVGTGHVALSRARTARQGRAYPIAAGGLVVALVIILLAIPRGAW